MLGTEGRNKARCIRREFIRLCTSILLGLEHRKVVVWRVAMGLWEGAMMVEVGSAGNGDFTGIEIASRQGRWTYLGEGRPPPLSSTTTGNVSIGGLDGGGDGRRERGRENADGGMEVNGELKLQWADPLPTPPPLSPSLDLIPHAFSPTPPHSLM